MVQKYGDPNIFRKYFIQTPELKDYLINYSINSIFYNSKKNIYNFDYIDYSKNVNINFENGIDFIFEHYIIYGQFQQVPIKFINDNSNKYDKITSSIAIVKANMNGAGFL